MAKSPTGRSKIQPRSVSLGGPRGQADEQRQEVGPLQRGLAVLGALLAEQRPLTSAEVADLVGLHSSTAHRLLQTLVEAGYVSRDSAKRYLPAAPALYPLNLYHPLNALRRIAFDDLRKLRQEFGLNTAMVVFMGLRRVVIEVLPGTDSFSPYYQVEVTVPAHASASGKLLLASLEPAVREELLGPGPYRNTAHGGTTLSRAEVDREIEQAIERGYATSLDEVADGLSGVASPFRMGNGRIIGCVSISGASKNFDAEFAERLTRAARRTTDLFSFATAEMAAVGRFLGY